MNKFAASPVVWKKDEYVFPFRASPVVGGEDARAYVLTASPKVGEENEMYVYVKAFVDLPRGGDRERACLYAFAASLVVWGENVCTCMRSWASSL